MSYLTLPFFHELEKAKNVLLAGAGGGYDIFTGLPLYFALQSAGKQVHLANVSSSYLPPAKTRQLSPFILKVSTEISQFVHSFPDYYFPEFYLSEWFKEQLGEDVPVYCLKKTGVKPLLKSYQALIEDLSLDTIILVDGGTDSLMRGDEVSVGTPIEDITSIVAANELDIEHRMLTCLGFGIDSFHGICHAQFLEAVADLTQKGGYLGMFSLIQEMPEVVKYREALEYVFKAMPKDISIVASSILSALVGHYGDYHAIPRTKGSQLWINPLMPVYWCFNVPQVAQRLLYPEQIKETEDFEEVITVISEFRNDCHDNQTIRSWENIPV
jgi:hypothetical protein